MEVDRSLAGELGGVAEEVEEDLPRLGQVAVDRAEVVGEGEAQRVPVLADDGVDRADHLVDHLADVERLQVELHPAGLDLRQVEDPVDEAEQVAARGLDLRQVGDVGRAVVLDGALLQQLAVEDDRVERRAELVAHVRHEFAARAVRLLDLLLARAQARDQQVELRGPLGLHAHLPRAAHAGDHEEDVLEDDPRRVLDPAPLE